ncbi:WG repeat-containing protein [bacterium]|nr:WG repeat-containing protein [bacterium]
MNRIIIILSCIFCLQTYADAQQLTNPSDNAPVFYTAAQQERDVVVFADGEFFGLKDKCGNIIAPPIYKKIVMTGRSGWIVQKKNKYGLMDSKGNYLIEPKFRYADRILGRYIKLGNDNDFGIYNEYGEAILEPVYSSIDLLYGSMFLTKRNYRYGVTDFKGNVLIPNICDDIYMPEKDTMKIKYLGEWYIINGVDADTLTMPKIAKENDDTELNFKEFIVDTGAISGYSVLTFSDYFIKVFSSISPAHEETIDDLILSHGVDTVGILKKFSWIPKYPVTFSKKYYAHLRNPFNGPLSDTRNRLKIKR